LIAGAEREGLARIADGAVLVGDQTGPLGGCGQVAEEAKLAVPPLVVVAHAALLAGLIVGRALVRGSGAGFRGHHQASVAGLASVVGNAGESLVVIVGTGADGSRAVLVGRDGLDTRRRAYVAKQISRAVSLDAAAKDAWVGDETD